MINQDYKNSALKSLSGNWAQALVAVVVFMIASYLVMGPSLVEQFGMPLPAALGYGSSLVYLLVLYPFAVGMQNAFRLLHETGDDRILNNSLSLGFGNWPHLVWGLILMGIFEFLWTMLFIIPGIIKAFSYAMTPYILVEHPEMSANQAINESIRLMKGHKFDLFYLYLSFIGWGILSVLTLGIGFLWLIPYMETSQAAFYADVKASAMMQAEAQ